MYSDSDSDEEVLISESLRKLKNETSPFSQPLFSQSQRGSSGSSQRKGRFSLKRASPSLEPLPEDPIPEVTGSKRTKTGQDSQSASSSHSQHVRQQHGHAFRTVLSERTWTSPGREASDSLSSPDLPVMVSLSATSTSHARKNEDRATCVGRAPHGESVNKGRVWDFKSVDSDDDQVIAETSDEELGGQTEAFLEERIEGTSSQDSEGHESQSSHCSVSLLASDLSHGSPTVATSCTNPKSLSLSLTSQAKAPSHTPCQTSAFSSTANIIAPKPAPLQSPTVHCAIETMWQTDYLDSNEDDDELYSQEDAHSDVNDAASADQTTGISVCRDSDDEEDLILPQVTFSSKRRRFSENIGCTSSVKETNLSTVSASADQKPVKQASQTIQSGNDLAHTSEVSSSDELATIAVSLEKTSSPGQRSMTDLMDEEETQQMVDIMDEEETQQMEDVTDEEAHQRVNVMDEEALQTEDVTNQETQQIEDALMKHGDPTMENSQLSPSILEQETLAMEDDSEMQDILQRVQVSDVKSLNPDTYKALADNTNQDNNSETAPVLQAISDESNISSSTMPPSADEVPCLVPSNSTATIEYGYVPSDLKSMDLDMTQPYEQSDDECFQGPPSLTGVPSVPSIFERQESGKSLSPPLLSRVSSIIVPDSSCSTGESSVWPALSLQALGKVKTEDSIGDTVSETPSDTSQLQPLPASGIKTERESLQQAFSVTVTLPADGGCSHLSQDVSSEQNSDAGQLTMSQNSGAGQLTISVRMPRIAGEGTNVLQSLKAEVGEQESPVFMPIKLETNPSLDRVSDVADADSDNSQSLFDDMPIHTVIEDKGLDNNVQDTKNTHAKQASSQQEHPAEPTSASVVVPKSEPAHLEVITNQLSTESMQDKMAPEVNIGHSNTLAVVKEEPFSYTLEDDFVMVVDSDEEEMFTSFTQVDVTVISDEEEDEWSDEITDRQLLELDMDPDHEKEIHPQDDNEDDDDTTKDSGLNSDFTSIIDSTDDEVLLAASDSSDDDKMQTKKLPSTFLQPTLMDDIYEDFGSDDDAYLVDTQIDVDDDDHSLDDVYFNDTQIDVGSIHDDEDEDDVYLNQTQVDADVLKDTDTRGEEKETSRDINTSIDLRDVAQGDDEMGREKMVHTSQTEGLMQQKAEDDKHSEDDFDDDMDDALFAAATQIDMDLSVSSLSETNVTPTLTDNKKSGVSGNSIQDTGKQILGQSVQPFLESREVQGEDIKTKVRTLSSEEVQVLQKRCVNDASLREVSGQETGTSPSNLEFDVGQDSESSKHCLASDLIDLTTESTDDQVTTEGIPKNTTVEGNDASKVEGNDDDVEVDRDVSQGLFDGSTLVDDQWLAVSDSESDSNHSSSHDNKQNSPQSECRDVYNAQTVADVILSNDDDEDFYTMPTQRDEDPYLAQTQVDMITEPISEAESDHDLEDVTENSKMLKVTEDREALAGFGIRNVGKDLDDLPASKSHSSVYEKGARRYSTEEAVRPTSSDAHQKRSFLKIRSSDIPSSEEILELARERMIKINQRNVHCGAIEIEAQPEVRRRGKKVGLPQKLCHPEDPVSASRKEPAQQKCLKSCESVQPAKETNDKQAMRIQSSTSREQAPSTSASSDMEWLKKKPAAVVHKTLQTSRALSKAPKTRKRKTAPATPDISDSTKKARQEMEARRLKAIINPSLVSLGRRQEVIPHYDPEIHKDAELPSTQQVFDMRLPLITGVLPISKQRLLRTERMNQDETPASESGSSLAASAHVHLDKPEEHKNRCEKSDVHEDKVVTDLKGHAVKVTSSRKPSEKRNREEDCSRLGKSSHPSKRPEDSIEKRQPTKRRKTEDDQEHDHKVTSGTKKNGHSQQSRCSSVDSASSSVCSSSTSSKMTFQTRSASEEPIKERSNIFYQFEAEVRVPFEEHSSDNALKKGTCKESLPSTSTTKEGKSRAGSCDKEGTEMSSDKRYKTSSRSDDKKHSKRTQSKSDGEKHHTSSRSGSSDGKHSDNSKARSNSHPKTGSGDRKGSDRSKSGSSHLSELGYNDRSKSSSLDSKSGSRDSLKTGSSDHSKSRPGDKTGSHRSRSASVDSSASDSSDRSHSKLESGDKKCIDRSRSASGDSSASDSRNRYHSNLASGDKKRIDHSKSASVDSSASDSGDRKSGGSSKSRSSDISKSGSSDRKHSSSPGSALKSQRDRSEFVDKKQDGSSRSESADKKQDGNSRAKSVDKKQDGGSRSESVDKKQDGGSRSESVDKKQAGSSRSESVDKKQAGSYRSESVDKKQDGSSRSESVDKKQAGSSRSESVDKKQNGSSRSESVDKKQDGGSRSESVDKKQNGSSRSESVDKKQDGSSRSESVDKKQAGSYRSESVDKKQDGSSRSESVDKKQDGSTRSGLDKKEGASFDLGLVEREESVTLAIESSGGNEEDNKNKQKQKNEEGQKRYKVSVPAENTSQHSAENNDKPTHSAQTGKPQSQSMSASSAGLSSKETARPPTPPKRSAHEASENNCDGESERNSRSPSENMQPTVPGTSKDRQNVKKSVRFNLDRNITFEHFHLPVAPLPTFEEILSNKPPSSTQQNQPYFVGNQTLHRPTPLREQQRQQNQQYVFKPLVAAANVAAAGPSGRENTEPARRLLASDDLLNRILSWSSQWFVEHEKYLEKAVDTKPDALTLPPVVDIKQLYPLVTTYGDRIEEYQSIFFKLLLLETWEDLFKSWKEKRNKVPPCHVFLTETSTPQATITLGWTGLLTGKMVKFRQFPGEGDMVVVSMVGHTLPMNSSQQPLEPAVVHPHLSFVEKTSITKCQNVRNLIDSYPVLKEHPTLQQEKHDLWLYKVSVKTRYRRFAPSKENLITISPVGSLIPALRRFSALQMLPRCPLMRDVLNPTPMASDITFQIPAALFERTQLNEEQNRAIGTMLHAASLPPSVSKLCLLQGPPGTGKSHVVVGLVLKILEKNKDAKICLSAPSNAAADELLRRLVKKKQTDKLNFSVVRIGNVDSIHSDVKEFALDNKIRRIKDEVLQKRKLASVPQSVRTEHERLKKKLEKLLGDIEKYRSEKKNAREVEKLKGELYKLRKQKETIDKQMSEGQAHVTLTPRENAEIYAQELKRPQVVCGTLSSFGQQKIISTLCRNPADYRRNNNHFTCTIIDEATQATELDSLIPLQYGVTKLFLVGDPNQLPPTVLSAKAQSLNYGLSLFERLYNHYQDKEDDDNPVLLLRTQYRMDPAICSFPNSYIYSDKLRTDENLKKYCQKVPFHPYIVFDIEEGQELLSQSGTLSNEMEADCTAVLCEELIRRDRRIVAGNIGVICPYAGQKRLVISKLHERNIQDVEVNTVDGFQGREKHIIILSCVRARSSSGGIGFMADKRRMNVALTRAKYGLYIIAHLQSYRADHDWKSLILDAESESRRVTRRVHSVEDFPNIIRQCCFKEQLSASNAKGKPSWYGV